VTDNDNFTVTTTQSTLTTTSSFSSSPSVYHTDQRSVSNPISLFPFSSVNFLQESEIENRFFQASSSNQAPSVLATPPNRVFWIIRPCRTSKLPYICVLISDFMTRILDRFGRIVNIVYLTSLFDSLSLSSLTFVSLWSLYPLFLSVSISFLSLVLSISNLHAILISHTFDYFCFYFRLLLFLLVFLP